MIALSGIFISLTFDKALTAGSEGELLIGVGSADFGREFSLGTHHSNHFKNRRSCSFSIGKGATVLGGQIPAGSPATICDLLIDQPKIEHVYLRKQGVSQESIAEMWQLKSVFVYLMGKGRPTRLFSSRGPTRLGSSLNSALWLAELGHGGRYLNLRNHRGERIFAQGAAVC